LSFPRREPQPEWGSQTPVAVRIITTRSWNRLSAMASWTSWEVLRTGKPEPTTRQLKPDDLRPRRRRARRASAVVVVAEKNISILGLRGGNIGQGHIGEGDTSGLRMYLVSRGVQVQQLGSVISDTRGCHSPSFVTGHIWLQWIGRWQQEGWKWFAALLYRATTFALRVTYFQLRDIDPRHNRKSTAKSFVGQRVGHLSWVGLLEGLPK
jgi:hypothetical protein